MSYVQLGQSQADPWLASVPPQIVQITQNMGLDPSYAAVIALCFQQAGLDIANVPTPANNPVDAAGLAWALGSLSVVGRVDGPADAASQVWASCAARDKAHDVWWNKMTSVPDWPLKPHPPGEPASKFLVPSNEPSCRGGAKPLIDAALQSKVCFANVSTVVDANGAPAWDTSTTSFFFRNGISQSAEAAASAAIATIQSTYNTRLLQQFSPEGALFFQSPVGRMLSAAMKLPEAQLRKAMATAFNVQEMIYQINATAAPGSRTFLVWADGITTTTASPDVPMSGFGADTTPKVICYPTATGNVCIKIEPSSPPPGTKLVQGATITGEDSPLTTIVIVATVALMAIAFSVRREREAP